MLRLLAILFFLSVPLNRYDALGHKSSLTLCYVIVRFSYMTSMADPPHLRFLLVFVSSASTRANEVQTCGFAFNKIIDFRSYRKPQDRDWYSNNAIVLDTTGRRDPGPRDRPKHTYMRTFTVHEFG